MDLVLLGVAGVLAFVLSFAIGANDVANALGTSVGSKALTVKQAIGVGALFEMLGVIAMGHLVSGTLKSEIISPELYGNDTYLFAIGMTSTLAGSATWLIIATLLALPVSTTQTIVGGIIGFASIEMGFGKINMWRLLNIGISWVVSPILGAIVASILYFSIDYFIYRSGDAYRRYQKLFPFYSSLTFSILLSFGLKSVFKYFGLSLLSQVLIVGGVFLVTLLNFFFWIMPCFERQEQISIIGRDLEDDSSSDAEVNSEGHFDRDIIEEKFKYLMILSAVFVSFAHGGNDVANAIGPFSAVLDYAVTGAIDPKNDMPFYVIIGGGLGIVVGLALLGYKVMETVGEKITKLSYSRGYCAQFSASLTVLLATAFGLPISTTSVLVGSIAGTGIVKSDSSEEGGLDRKMLLKILLGWIFTIVAGYCLTAVVYFIARAMVQP